MSSQKLIEALYDRQRAKTHKLETQVEDAEHLIAVMVDNLGQSVNDETSNAYLKYVQKYGIPVAKEDNGTTTDT